MHADVLEPVAWPDIVSLLLAAHEEGIGLAVVGDEPLPERFRVDVPGAAAEFDLVVAGKTVTLFEPPYERYERRLETHGVPAERGVGRFLFHDLARTLYVDADPTALAAAGALGFPTLAVDPGRPEAVLQCLRVELGL